MSSLISKSLGALALAALLGSAGTLLAHEAPAVDATTHTVTVKQAATQAALRDLWIGHIFWVRNVALETMDGNGAAAKAAEAEASATQNRLPPRLNLMECGFDARWICWSGITARRRTSMPSHR
jgi:hypothetical protein